MTSYRIEGPATISFSGGRTSGYMLRQILDAHGGTLPPDVHVIFANTGKERPETLDFVQACAERWSVRVRWIEWQRTLPRWREVDHATASRDGRPFDELIKWKSYLPNPVQRLCTQHLKIDAMKRFIRESLGLERWTCAVGIRHDEPRRWRILGQDSRNKREFKVGPLVSAKVTEPDVMAFWAAQPFDLSLSLRERETATCAFSRARRSRSGSSGSAPTWPRGGRATSSPAKASAASGASPAPATRRWSTAPAVNFPSFPTSEKASPTVLALTNPTGSL